MNAGRDDGRECIIVADAELCDGNRVVLVDNRNRIQLQQALDRVLEILVPDRVGDIVRRQQNLCDGVAVFGEQLRFLYKGIIIKHNKTEPTYTKTSLFLCEKRRFFMARTEKGVVATI